MAFGGRSGCQRNRALFRVPYWTRTKPRRHEGMACSFSAFVALWESDSFRGENFTENTAIIFRNLCLKTAGFQLFRAASPAPSVNFQIPRQVDPENIQTAVPDPVQIVKEPVPRLARNRRRY